MSMIVVAALYKFADLPDFRDLKEPLLACCRQHGIMGTILLAHEGINGTVAGRRDSIDALFAYLHNDERLAKLERKEAQADSYPFHRMKVRLKKEIVTLGVPEVDPVRMGGTYVEPEDWNKLVNDPHTCLVDTRNDYEVEIGTFKGAINPHTKSFRDFPQFVDEHLDPAKQPKVAMFCTGGIRCEKATALLRQRGFKEVYHLRGGILKYLELVPEAESAWEGECFVFDDRVTVDHQLAPGVHEMCHACRHAISVEDMASPHFTPGVSCPHCYDKTTDKKKASAAARQYQMELAKERGQTHLGDQTRDSG